MAPQPLSLKMVLRGGYTAATTGDAPEIWVNTLSLFVCTGSLGDQVGPLPTNFSVEHATISDSDTGWSASSDWRLEGGINDFDPVSYLVDQVMPAVFTWQAMAGKSNKSELRQVDIYPVDTSGHAIGPAGFGAPTPASILFDAGARPVGGSSTDLEPLQTSCAVSHYTPYKGRKGRGRMFLAGIGDVAIQSDGHFTSTFVNNALAYQVSLLEALTIDDEAISVRPALIPNGDTFAFITECRVGDVPDTQRRRRNQIPETYVSDTVA